MPDIFDTVEEPQTGDLFDQVSEQPNYDVFDELAPLETGVRAQLGAIQTVYGLLTNPAVAGEADFSRRLAELEAAPPSLQPLQPGAPSPFEPAPVRPPPIMPSFPPIEGLDLAGQEEAAKRAGTIEPSLWPKIVPGPEEMPTGEELRTALGQREDVLKTPFNLISALGQNISALETWAFSPEGVSEVGASKLKAARPAVFAKWFYDMAAGTGQMLGEAYELLKKPDKTEAERQEMWNKIIGGVSMPIFAFLLGKGAANDLRTRAREVRNQTAAGDKSAEVIFDELTGRVREKEARPFETPERFGPPRFGTGFVPRGAVPPVGPPPEPLQIVPPDLAAVQAARMTREATAGFEPVKPPPPTVPGGPGAPSDPRVQVIRDKNILTVDEVRKEFGIQSREEARALLWDAVPELRPPPGPQRPEFTPRPPVRPPGVVPTAEFQPVAVTAPEIAPAPETQVPPVVAAPAPRSQFVKWEVMQGPEGEWFITNGKKSLRATEGQAQADKTAAALNSKRVVVSPSGQMYEETLPDIEKRVAKSPETPKVLPPGAPQETITGPDVQKGTAMPAEAPQAPKARPAQERPWDIIDHIKENVGARGKSGKINLALARKVDPEFTPTGLARSVFTAKGGVGPDVVLDGLHRMGLFRNIETESDFLDAIRQAGKKRQGDRKRGGAETRAIAEQAQQADQFAKKVLQGQRPKAEKKNVETVNVGNLLEGDEFEVQGFKFTVEDVKFDEDGNMTEVTLRDGPKFGVQQLDRNEVIHIDRDSLKTKEVGFGPEDETPVPPPEEPPKGNAKFGNLDLGVSQEQWDEMAKYNDAEQMARWGTTRSKLIAKVSLEAQQRREQERGGKPPAPPPSAETLAFGGQDKGRSVDFPSKEAAQEWIARQQGRQGFGDYTVSIDKQAENRFDVVYEKKAAAPEVKKPLFNPAEQARVDEILKKLKAKLDRPPTQMGMSIGGAPFDPELFTLGGELAYHYIKAGVRKFGDFATHMINDLGEKAKDYLLSWYSNAKLRLTDIAHELDSEESAKRQYDERFGPAGVAAGPEVSGRVRGGGGVGGRPGIRIARKELIPVPRQHVGVDSYAARSGFRLDEEQVNGINLILDRFLGAPKGAFVLADGTGFGKTAQMLAVADQYRKRGLGNAILVVTQNKQVVEGRFKEDARRMGIDPNLLTITTYTSLKKLPHQPWDLVIFDEAHNLKNAEAKKSIAAAMLEPKHALFGTATPMDRPTGAAYFLAEITGKTETEIAHALGYELVDRVDPLTQKPYQAPVLLPGFSWAKVWQNIMAYRDAAVKMGAMIRREYPFFGKVETTPVSMTSAAKAEHDQLVDFYDQQIKRARNPQAKRNWAGQKTNALGRWAEQQKLDEAVRLAKEHLDAGGQVVIVAETDKRQFMRVKIQGSVPGIHPESGNEGFFVEGAVTQIEKMLNKLGITDISHIHDPTKYDIAQNVRDFQSGKNRVALATPASGGTGIDLDDAVGNKPRLMIALSKSFAGDQFEQLIGRISRKNTKSPSAVKFIELEGSFGDERRNDILDKKIKTLKAIQGGEDLDVAGGFEAKGAKAMAREEAGFTEPEVEEPAAAVAEMPAPATGQAAGPTPTPTTQEEAEQTINAKAPGLIASAVDGLLSGFLPSAITPKHLEAAERLGSKIGKRNRRAESSAHVLDPYGSEFDRIGVFRKDLPPTENPGLQFASDMSQGREMTGWRKNLSDLIEKLFKQRLVALQEAGAPLKTIRENYFPGIWTKESRLAFNAAMDKARAEGILGADFDINNATDAQKAYVKNLTDQYLERGLGSEKDALVFIARRPMGGRESFRKQKVFEDIMDGAQFGLRPASYNPVDLVKLKLAEMDQQLLLREHAQDLRSTGEDVFINPYKQIPQGWMKHPDKKYGTVYGPPTTKLEEFVDKMTYDGLMKVAKALKLDVERRYSAGRGRLGFASTSGQTVTQFATELSVLAHEIGHQLDFKYGLRSIIGKAKTTEEELRALADLSWQGRAEEDVAASYKRKVRKEAEKMAHLLEAYISAPQAFEHVAPNVYKSFDAFLKSKPELKPLTEIRPGISLERLTSEKYVGLPIMGYRIVPIEHGQIIENYLSSSLYNSRIFGKFYAGWMAFANLLNQSQLGMGSAFHAGFTTGEAQVSANAIVLKEIYGVLRGNRSLENLGRSVTQAAGSVVRNPVMGDRILNAWRDPDGTADPRVAQIVRAAELAGAGFRLETGLQTQQTVKLLRDWYSDARLKAAARSPIAFTELLAKPVMELLVPRQKAGVFADLAARIIDQNPGKTLEELTPQFRQAWNRVDARLGQVRYNRLFMVNWIKNLIQAAIRAPGWSGGTITELGGGFTDAARFMQEFVKTGKLPENLPDRTAYVLSLIATTTFLNGALTYAFTGTMPQGLDFFAFRDGTKDEQGRAGRLMLPTYMKDIIAYARHPGETLLAKTHPVLSIIADLAKNKDYYGVEIASRDAGPGQRAGERGAYVVKSFEPFWTRGARREIQRQAGVAKATLPLIGIMPAPRAVTETDAERLAHDLALERVPQGARTKAQAERARARYLAEPPTEPYLERTVKKIDALSAVRVFEAANPAEQKRIYYDVLEKIDRSQTLTDAERDDLERRLNAARKR